MAAFDRIKPGDVLYDARRVQMGNTTMRRLACWKVLVISVDREKRTADCSWNSNPVRTYREAWLGKLRRSRPAEST